MQSDVPSENVTLFSSRVVLENSISPISPLLKRIINDNLANSHENEINIGFQKSIHTT